MVSKGDCGNSGDRTSFGFRKFRSTYDACEQVFFCLCRENSPEWVLEGDIKGCFDNISHQWLIDNIPIDKSILNICVSEAFLWIMNILSHLHMH
ncbi:MAG TPA: reverse transcriptase domain-containing protein [Candidatus Methanoperedens sp.]